jgi:hypothetical protein
VRATGLATYPDVSVVCGRAELDPEDLPAVGAALALADVYRDPLTP